MSNIILNLDSNRNNIKSEIMRTTIFSLVSLGNKVNYNKFKLNNNSLINSTNLSNKFNLIGVCNDSRLFN